MRPLYYSMLLLFKDGKERCVNDVFNELKGEYSGFKDAALRSRTGRPDDRKRERSSG